jgi:branched-chain amino acid transport system permease protein
LGSAGLVAVAIVASRLLTGSTLSQLSNGLAVALIMLSLVLLTGYGGQVSLCQYTWAGFGAVAFSKMAHGGNPLALVPVALICGVVGALVALPALRLQGLYLALATLAFAVLADKVYFSHVFGLGSLNIAYLHIPGVAIGRHSNLVLLAVAFSLLGMLVLAIRRGPFGRLLSAMADSPAACATLGLDLTITKLAVFAISAAMAGVAGALYGGTQGLVTANNFYYVQSLILLLLVSIAGINTVSGAFLGGMSLALINIINPHLPHALQQLPFLATGLGAIMLGKSRNGVVGQLSDTLESLRARRLSPARPVASLMPQEVAGIASAN